MESARLQREHLDNRLQHSALASDVPKMAETGQIRVIAHSTSLRHTGKWISTTQHVTAFFLLVGFFAGVYLVGIHSYTSGLFRLLGEANKSEFLPLGKDAYRHVFTHIPAIDSYLEVFTPFFEPLAGRQNDSSYLFWVWMIPQLGVLWALLMMENLRGGPGKETYL